MNRREFLAGSAAGLLILRPQTVRGYQANSAVALGLLGCGQRGTTVAASFAKNTTARVVALADIFPDKLAQGKQHFDNLAAALDYSGPELLFHGAHAYDQLANAKQVDAIQISTPPFFHVEHLAAAVAGGKHAYCEKPVGVDVWQANRALQIGKKLDPKLSVDVGFQLRSNPPFVELVKRIHDGAVGKLVSITAHYYAPAIGYPDQPASMSKDELRLRNWNWDLVLSGDIVVEQNIHVIDICNWVLQSHPVAAYATGGRDVLTHWGDNFDNYQVDFTYPNGVHVSFTSKQYGPEGEFDVSEQVFGSDGYSLSPYAGPIKITGPKAWQWAPTPDEQQHTANFATNGAFSDNLANADREKDKGFIESITSGERHNQIELGVQTALSAMMARMAARKKKIVTWDEMLLSNEHWELGMNLDQFS